MSKSYYQEFYWLLKSIRLFGGFPYTWKENECQLKLKPSIIWSMHSVIFSIIVFPYHICLLIGMKMIRERYASNPILWTTYSTYTILRLLMTSILFLNVSILKVDQLKNYVKQALKLCRKWNCKCSLRQKIQVEVFRFALFTINLSPWLSILATNSDYFFILAIVALDSFFLLRATMRHLKALYYSSLLTCVSLRQCFDIFFQDNKVDNKSSRRYISAESVTQCMRRYKQIQKFVRLQMTYFKSIIVSAICLLLCFVITATYCLTQVLYTEDFYVFLSLDVTAIVSLILFFNSMMLQFIQVRKLLSFLCNYTFLNTRLKGIIKQFLKIKT